MNGGVKASPRSSRRADLQPRPSPRPPPRRGSAPGIQVPLESVRLALYVCLLYASIAIGDGHLNFVVNGIGLLACLTLSILRRPRFYRLHMIWTVAYLYIIVNEGIFGADDILKRIAQDNFDVAASYLNAANAAVLLGHSFIFRERKDDAPLTEPMAWPARAGQLFWPQLYLALWSAAYAVVCYPLAMNTLAAGRVGTKEEYHGTAGDVIVAGLVSAAGLTLPAMITYYLIFVRRSRPILAALVCAPIFAIQFAIGVRFALMMALIGAVLVYVSRFPLNRASLPRLAGMGVLGGALYVSTMVMREVRVFGASDFDPTATLESLRTSFEGGYEGCVRLMSQIVEYFRYHDYLFGQSSGNIFIFWIPRQLWPSKPTMLGYWFPRAYADSRGYSTGHSVSSGFPADFYVDFGFWGGLFSVALLGVLLGYVERRVAWMIDRRAPTMVLATAAYGAAFFAVRSPQTTLIVMSGVMLLAYGFAWSLRTSTAPSAKTTLRAPLPRRTRRQV